MSGGQKLALEGEVTIFAAQAVKEQLLAALEAGEALEVDLSQVTELDSAGVQLMVAAKGLAQTRGQALTFTGHSPAVVATLDLCDLSSHFGDPVLLPRAGKDTP